MTEQVTPTEEIVLTKKRAKAPRKPKAPKEPSDLRYVFKKHIRGITPEKIKKPWMAEKSFKLINTPEALEAWADAILADKSRHLPHPSGITCPVIAVDTENTGLDTRILVHMEDLPDGTRDYVYEVKIEIAGVCLSADGVEGIYVPIHHERGPNVCRADANRILQKLFNQSHLVFYNAKYDREVLRLCLGLDLRDYPFYEDVSALQYINDPKADLGDKGQYTGDTGGLKALSKNFLQLEQIDLKEIAKVRADKWDAVKQKNVKKEQHVPFTWVPQSLALWYAASDAICTWLLWKRMHELARSRKIPHRIDGELNDSLTWIERQRYLIDVERHRRTSAWHEKKVEGLSKKLRELALAAGWQEKSDDAGNVLPEDQFNPGSPVQLSQLLFDTMKLPPYRVTDSGNRSTDAETLKELLKQHPDNEFLNVLQQHRDYAALHPGNLHFDPTDNSARMFLKQNRVAGGRLSGAGGDYDEDGGFELNPQGIVKVEEDEQWRVYGNVLEPDTIPEDQIEEYTEADLHPSCFHDDKGKHTKAANIIKNHIGQYQGYAICLVPKCTTCAEKFGILIHDTSMDAEEAVNLRCLFVAEEGWTMFSIDYSNIEVRAAANLSGEPELQNIFLYGDGDHHALTASKVFPQYADPTSKDYKAKSLRALAKIINFALQYGGTEFTIYENMKKRDPNITREAAKKMVDDYWAGVPVFAQWCEAKKFRAKTEMVCETAMGRVIDFKSAMEAQRIHVPTKEEKDNLSHYYDLRRQATQAEKEGKPERQKKWEDAAQRLWKDPETGVRNAQDYNKFIGKIQRVAVNAPVQGICGDFMRLAINRIRKWVLSNPDIQKVFRFHGSVHDEIDVSIKNEYIPFILPRLTRLMKLRKLYERFKWPVPIECDAEYGRSWDVDYNATDKNKPDAYTHIKGLERYIPPVFEPQFVREIIKSLLSGDEATREKIRNWVNKKLHPRAAASAGIMFTDKKGNPITDKKTVTNKVITILQLHEFWSIDHTPDDDEATLETLEQYEASHGLTEKDRGFAPEFGYLGAVPLTAKVKRPDIPPLGDDEVPAQAELPIEPGPTPIAEPPVQIVETPTEEMGADLAVVTTPPTPPESVDVDEDDRTITEQDFVPVTLPENWWAQAWVEVGKQIEEGERRGVKNARGLVADEFESKKLTENIVADFAIAFAVGHGEHNPPPFEQRLELPDVSPDISVKAIDKLYGKTGRAMSLLVPPYHLDPHLDWRFVLVYWEDHNKNDFKIIGWLYGHEIKKYRLDDGGNGRDPAYFVPWTKLRPWSTFEKPKQTMLYILRDDLDLSSKTTPDALRMRELLGKGGGKEINIRYRGENSVIRNKMVDEIPDEFLTGKMPLKDWQDSQIQTAGK